MLIPFYTDDYFMSLAMGLAQQAFDEEEVPVGAIIVYKNRIIGKGYNQTKCLKDATAHAEMLAITSATHTIGKSYLLSCSIYVSMEPCLMCAGAIKNSRIERLIFATKDKKKGYNTLAPLFHPCEKVTEGILKPQSEKLLQSFFTKKRIP